MSQPTHVSQPTHGRHAAAPTGSTPATVSGSIARIPRRSIDALRPAAARVGAALGPITARVGTALRPAAAAARTVGAEAYGKAQHAFDRLPSDAARVGLSVAALATAGALVVATNLPALAAADASIASAEQAAAAGRYESAHEHAGHDHGASDTIAAAAGDVQTLEVSPSAAMAATLTPESYAVEAAPPPIASSVAGLGTISLGQARTIVWPVVDPSRTSSGFGPRDAPCSGCSTYHDGVDFTPGVGTPVLSIADGIVVLATENGGGLGVNVEIQHNIDGQVVTTSYAHMQYGSLQVVAGQQVSAGQQIGMVGTTGQSTGPHLHLEMFGADGVRFDGFAWLHARLG